MNIHFTYHAQIRLHERGFSIEQMKETILNPDFTRYSNDDRIVIKKRFDHGSLEVVYSRRGNRYIIITVYFPYN